MTEGMNDRAVSMGCVVAYGLWAISGLLMVLGVAIWDDRLADHLTRFGLWTCGAAVTATVRAYLVAAHGNMRRFYELGRDAAERGVVSSLR